ncbi:hypothetical protein GCM10027592_60140 [Spirosoma flavus]
MDAQLIEADDRLANVFSHFYVVRQPKDAPTVRQQLLPNYEMLLAFNFGPDLPAWMGNSMYRLQRTAVMGPLQKLLRYDVGPGTDLIVIVFTLNGFYRLFGKTIQLRGSIHADSATSTGAGFTDGDMLMNPECLENLWKKLAATCSLDERIQHFSDYAMQHLAPFDATMQTLFETIPHFRHSQVDPIKAVAQDHQLSTRTMQLRFQHQLGYSAKELTRFLRFKKLITQLLNQPPVSPDWSELVFMYGYHDQSHLIRDFQYFTGLTPSTFIKQLADQSMCISQPGKFY